MVSRRAFLRRAMAVAGSVIISNRALSFQKEYVMTVKGPISPSGLKFTLSHEHIIVDFIGADKVSKDRYNQEEVFKTALPYLMDVKKRGCSSFIDCTPPYLGRDANLLKKLADETGLNIITPTGYYGAAQEKHIPEHAYSESAEQLAARWISEWKNGIEGSGIKPGFIKTGVDSGPLSEVQRKLIEAAAITHLATGLTIGVHTGNGAAAEEQLEILASRKVAPSARIWIHAQNEKDHSYHIKAAQRGSWVSFDGIGEKSIEENVNSFKVMKEAKLLARVLASQDSGWYNVGDPGGGKFNHYNTVFTDFIPALKKSGFSQKEIDGIFVSNPAKAFTIGVRKITS